MTRRVAFVALIVSLFVAALPARQVAKPYFPPAATWEARDGAVIGFDKAKLDEAIAFAVKNENPNNKDLAIDIPNSFRQEAPYNTVDGPTQLRAGSNGVIIRKGYVAAQWGDVDRADMTFSVTKSFLSTVVGLAVDRGQIKSVNDRVAPYMPKDIDLFTSPKNAPITWDHLLRQTSDWSGELWGQPDWADRPVGANPEEWKKRPEFEPGTNYKYNDVRVNVLSLATLYVMKQPLPATLKMSIMDPIGASSSWHWEPYNNAYLTIDGKRMPSVPGGGHHGGGMFINALDMARFGYLFLRNGNWNGKQLISQKWIDLAKTPGTSKNAGGRTYGFMNWFLNVPRPREDGTTGPRMYASAPLSVVCFQGNGANLVYIDWENDVVAVVRWIRNGSANDFFGKILASLN